MLDVVVSAVIIIIHNLLGLHKLGQERPLPLTCQEESSLDYIQYDEALLQNSCFEAGNRNRYQ